MPASWRSPATRIRRFPLGTVNGRWSTTGGAIARDLLASPARAERSTPNGTIAPARGRPVDALLPGATSRPTSTRAASTSARYLPAAGLAYPILGRVTGSGRIAGVFPRLAIGGHAAVSGGQIGPFPVASADATTRIVGDRVSLDSAVRRPRLRPLHAPRGWSVSAPADPLSLHIHAIGPRPGRWRRKQRRCRSGRIDVAGALESDALISGSFAKPKLKAGFDLAKPRYGQLLVQRIIGSLESDFDSVHLEQRRVRTQSRLGRRRRLAADLAEPGRHRSGRRPRSRSPPTRTASTWPPLAPLLPGTGTKLTGTVDGHLALEGTVRAPRVLGSVSLSNGSYVSNVETSPIRDAAAPARLRGDVRRPAGASTRASATARSTPTAV